MDYAQLIKIYGEPTGQKGHERKYSPSECTGTRKRRVEGNGSLTTGMYRPAMSSARTSPCVMHMRRFTPPDQCFFKEV